MANFYTRWISGTSPWPIMACHALLFIPVQLHATLLIATEPQAVGRFRYIQDPVTAIGTGTL
ncbi:MAG TPA: hypothetical protein VK040_10210 [Balneolaceae bacterium]|nr:hypothetical protein [Balneolaceae bacterium]